MLSISEKILVKDYQEGIPWDGISIQKVTQNDQGIYEIYNAAELAWIAKEMYYGVEIKIMSDIDLGGKCGTLQML